MAESILKNFPKPETQKPSENGERQDWFKKLEQAEAVQKAQASEKPSGWTGAAEDVLKSGAAGLGRGVASIPGIVGDVSQLVQRTPAYASWLAEQANAGLQQRASQAPSIYQKKMGEVEAKMTPEERTGMVGQVAGYNFPTGEATISAAQEYIPGLGYQPKTPAGKFSRAAGEFIGAGVPITKPLTVLKLATAPSRAIRPLAKEAVVQGTAGIGGEAARQYAEGTPYEMPAMLAGAVLGGVGGTGVAARLPGAAAERGQRLARDIIETAGVKPSDTRLPPTDFVPGVTPTTTQLLRNKPELQGLASRLEREGGPEVERLHQQREASEEALARASQVIPAAAEAQKPFTSMSEALGLPSVQDPMLEASKRAHDAFRIVEEPMYQAQQQIWKNPVFKNATYDKNAVTKSIDDAVNKMGISFQGLPREMKDYLTQLKKFQSDEIPFSEIQKTKEFANAMIRNPNIMDKSGPIALTTGLDDLLTDSKNLSATSAAQFPNAGSLFDEARKRTREYHSLFSTKVTKPLSERHLAGHVEEGEYVLQPEQMLNKVFGEPKNALSKYRELRSIPGMNIDDAASDWIVGKLTNNGQKAFVTVDDIQKMLRDPNYAALVNEVPNLRNRLAGIAKQGINEQVSTSFAQVLENPNPDLLNKYIKQNRETLNRAFPSPNQQNFIDQLERSSEVLGRIKPGYYINDKLFNKLMQGDLFTILHGKAVGKLASAATGYAVGKAIGIAAPIAVGAEIAGAGAGAVGMLPQKTSGLLARLVYGTTQDEAVNALNRAMRDPAFMKFLMEKPTIENTMRLRDFLMKTTPKVAAKTGFTGYRVGEDLKSLPPEKTEESYQRLVKEGKIKPAQADGGRIGRAAGGRIDVQRGVRALMRAAENAKKSISKTTEPLLDQPDEHIAQALDMAKKHI